MVEQDVLNYASGDAENVFVPRKFRAGKNSTEVELAYITPKEAGILATLRPGSPHRGPMEVPSYDDFDASGNYRSGAAMSAAESGKHTADTLAAGMGRHEVRDLHAATQAAAAQSQRNQRGGGNFLSNLGGGIKNLFGGLGNKLGAWAGKMRGGINPATGEYYTQDEYEQNVQNRRNQASIDRLRKTRDTKYANDPEGWAASDLSNRLAGFENQLGIKPQGIESGFISEAEYNAQPEFNFNTGPEVLPTNYQFTGDLKDYQRGLVRNVADYNTAEMFEDVGAKSGWVGGNKTADAMQKYYDQAMTYFNPDTGQFTGKKGATTPADVRSNIDLGSSLYGIDMDQIPENFLETLQDYKKQKSPYEVIGIATGGRVGYKTGGRVGILAAF